MHNFAAEKNFLTMRKFLLFFALLAPLLPSEASTDWETTDSLVYECLNDATRLDEARHLIDSVLAQPAVEKQPFYPVLLYRQASLSMMSGHLLQARRQLHRIAAMMPIDTLAEFDICVPNDIGISFRREGQNDSALYYYDRAMQAAIRHGDKEWQTALNTNIGTLHYNLDHTAEAETFLDRAIVLARQTGDPYTELTARQVCAAVKLKVGKVNEARSNIETAYRMALEAELPDWQLRCLTTMAGVYEQQHLPDSATLAIQRGNALLPQLPSEGITAIGFLTARANYHYGRRQWQQAAADFTTVLATPASGTRTTEFYNKLSHCYAELHQWQLAYQYKDSASACAKRMADERFARQMAEFDVRYQTMEKDIEIARLEDRHARLLILGISLAVVLALLFAGLWLWQRQHRFRREARLRIGTLEEERSRIARELHDGLCNDMLALEMQCVAGSTPQQTAHQLNLLRQQARQLSHQLMPPEFTHLSLPELLGYLSRDVSSAQHVSTTFTDNTGDGQADMDSDIAHALYRIAQEHTANIVKGGTATTIAITLEPRQLTITDNGQPAGDHSRGIGLRTIQDRAASIQATVSSTSSDGCNILRVEL